jgi:cytosine/adenosine deaminase-related metal-dependent hydrolase
MTLNMTTYGGADVVGAENYGLQVGNQADFVVVAGETLTEAVMNRNPQRIVVKKGCVVARNGACLG